MWLIKIKETYFLDLSLGCILRELGNYLNEFGNKTPKIPENKK